VQLDIIIPAHNEQHRIGRTLDDYRHTCNLADTAFDTRFVVALDDCTDATAQLVAEHGEEGRVVSRYFPRLGKGGVLAEAFRDSHADYVAFVDADGATPPEELLRLVQACEHLDTDIAIASRYHPASVLPVARRRSRQVTARCFAAVVRQMFKLPYFDTQCGAKVLRRSAVERITPLLSARDFVFDVDLLTTARALGFRVAEVPTVWLDRDGSRLATNRDSLRMLASLAVLWLRQRVVPVQLPAADVVELPAGEVTPQPQPGGTRVA
jgi:glycosyltransferase involved in cell wall biosynthesis